MARTPSTMVPLGTLAPDFSLPDAVSGETVSTAGLSGAPALVVMFICNHCPFVQHVADELARLGAELQARDVAVVGISANDVDSHPDDSPEMMAKEAAARGYTFPYLFDESQQVAAAYRAACTPDFFVFDADRRLAYRGQMDASRPGNGIEVTGADLRAAVEHVLAGRDVPEPHHPSMGCSIKWRPENEPTD